MLANSVSGVSFAGKYQLNANQNMPDKEACLKRDAVIGFWTAKAKNGEEVQKQLKDFYTSSEYEKDPNKNLDIVLELDDADSTEFEKSMDFVGQKFSVVA